MSETSGAAGRRTELWWWPHPRPVAAASLAVFAVILVLWWTVAGMDDSISILYVLPVVLLALGFGVRVGLAGGAAAAEQSERRAAELALLQREAAQISDSVLQVMAATKWMLESGRVASGIELLEENMSTAQRLVSRMMGPDSMLPGDRPLTRV